VAFLESNGWFVEYNQVEEIDQPSYSVMHAMSDGFSIKFWSATHRTAPEEGQLHQQNCVRIVVPPDMILVWHQRLFHAGARCRLTKCNQEGRYGFHLSTADADKSPSRKREPQRPYTCLEDARMFGYINCPEGKQFLRGTDGKVSSGDRLYMKKQLFCSSYDETGECDDCDKGEYVLDLSFIECGQYKNGELVVGDLQKLGWAMYRSRYMGTFNETLIRNIIGKGAWHAIGDSNNTRMMKYDTSSVPSKAWKSPGLKDMFQAIKENIFDKVLPNNKYIWPKPQVLKNQGVSVRDQAGHYDYEPS